MHACPRPAGTLSRGAEQDDLRPAWLWRQRPALLEMEVIVKGQDQERGWGGAGPSLRSAQERGLRLPVMLLTLVFLVLIGERRAEGATRVPRALGRMLGLDPGPRGSTRSAASSPNSPLPGRQPNW